MRNVRLLNKDLAQAGEFLDTLLSKNFNAIMEKEQEEPAKLNGVAFKPDNLTRFSEPPAPPPSQPLPEKPDVARINTTNPPELSLKRSNTEKPKPAQGSSPIRQDSSQVISLVEALATARKEIESQSERMRDLEEMLMREREARELAEKRAQESSESHMNGSAKGSTTIDPAVPQPPLDGSNVVPVVPAEGSRGGDSTVEKLQSQTAHLQERIDQMVADMHQMKQHMETYRLRAETAEAERDEARETLKEKITRIRAEEAAKASRPKRGRSRSGSPMKVQELSSDSGEQTEREEPKASVQINGTALSDADVKALEQQLSLAISRSKSPLGANTADHHLLQQSAPYASMLGVVLFGMGLMAYINGWQKVDKGL
jgi:hypothetical protein